MNIRSYTFEEFVERVHVFHGFAAPGVLIGGFMVDLAYQHLPQEGLFDAISETPKCLPDAVQLLTPCTVGNGWLTVINLGRYAITLYDKSNGQGVRVFLDPAKIEAWSEIKGWFFKLKTKKEQDDQLHGKAAQSRLRHLSPLQRKLSDWRRHALSGLSRGGPIRGIRDSG
jgi:formylmethanofuran dehydrogenase subunit E